MALAGKEAGMIDAMGILILAAAAVAIAVSIVDGDE